MPYELDLAIAQDIDRTMRFLRRSGLGPVERIVEEPQGLAEGVGRTFFVSSTSSKSASTNTGLEPSAPFSTIAQAVAAASADRGDVIYVMAGHAETVTASLLTINKAGVQII